VSERVFANLHHHTTFSYGDGFGTPAQHVERAAELGYSHIAATEHGNTSSHFQLEKAALKAGLHPIFGLEAYCGPTEEATRGQYKHHLTVLARDAEGYRALNRIVSQSWRDHYYHPTVSGGSLAANSAGLVALSGCSGSLLACALLGGKGTPEHNDRPDYRAARDVIERFRALFGEWYYLEVQPFYELDRTLAINVAYERLSRQSGVPLVVTHDVHYPRQEDSVMQAVLHAVHRGKESIDDAMRKWNYDVPLTLPDDDNSLYYRLRKTGMGREAAISAIENSALIAQACQVTLPKAERLAYPIREEDLEPWV
jgi:DNA polymerase III subunit alpha